MEKMYGVKDIYEKDFDTVFHVEAALKADTLFHNDREFSHGLDLSRQVRELACHTPLYSPLQPFFTSPSPSATAAEDEGVFAGEKLVEIFYPTAPFGRTACKDPANTKDRQ